MVEAHLRKPSSGQVPQLHASFCVESYCIKSNHTDTFTQLIKNHFENKIKNSHKHHTNHTETSTKLKPLQKPKLFTQATLPYNIIQPPKHFHLVKITSKNETFNHLNPLSKTETFTKTNTFHITFI